MKTIATLAAIPLGLALVYGTVQHLSPGLAAELRGWARVSQDWSEEAMQSDPVGFLEATRTRLERERGRLGGLVQELRTAMGPLDGHIEERAAELAKTDAFLREGRGLYQQVAANPPADGVRFAGRHYPDLPTFKAQLELLFSEKSNGQSLLEQARATRARLNDRLSAMLLQAGKLDSAIEQVGPQIAIVRAERSAAAVDRTIAAGRRLSEGVIDETARLIDDFPIGTTRDLLKTAPAVQSVPIGGNPAFDAFLRTAG